MLISLRNKSRLLHTQSSAGVHHGLDRSCHCRVIACLPRWAIERLAIVMWKILSLVNARARWKGIARYETGRDVLALAGFSANRVAAGSLHEKSDRPAFMTAACSR